MAFLLQKMATAKESSEEEEEELRALERKVRELRTAKKELLAKTRPVDVELKKITQHERECVDKLQRLRAEKHDREKQKQTVQRLIELEADMKCVKCENEALKRENETLKRTNSKCTVTNNNLKQSLDEAAKNSKSLVRKIAELNAKISALQQPRSADIRRFGIENSSKERLRETSELLSKTKQELNETQRRLSVVQERLTVAEQVTAATQQRALQESDNSEQLQLELTPQHQPTASTGLNILFSLFELELSYRSYFAL